MVQLNSLNNSYIKCNLVWQLYITSIMLGSTYPKMRKDVKLPIIKIPFFTIYIRISRTKLSSSEEKQMTTQGPLEVPETKRAPHCSTSAWTLPVFPTEYDNLVIQICIQIGKTYCGKGISIIDLLNHSFLRFKITTYCQ